MIKKILFLIYLVSIIKISYSQSISWNDEQLTLITGKYKNNDPKYVQLVGCLISSADSVLNIKHKPSVTYKTKYQDITKDLNDYASLATYYWPNKLTRSGLPYVRIDGKVNTNITILKDLGNLTNLSKRLMILTLAFNFTNNRKYSEKSIELLNNWFLDPITRMNPNFNHAQAILGQNKGRIEGIIEARYFIDIVNCIQLLATKKVIPSKNLIGYKEWFTEFISWMENSKIGRKGYSLKNNIGTNYILQLIAYNKFIGRGYNDKINNIQGLLRSQFKNNGLQALEYKRAKPDSYSIANLYYLLNMKNILDKDEVNNNIIYYINIGFDYFNESFASKNLNNYHDILFSQIALKTKSIKYDNYLYNITSRSLDIDRIIYFLTN